VRVLTAQEKLRREVIDELNRMSAKELFDLAVEAGIQTPDGKLTPPYRTPKPRRRKAATRARKR
jgi:hypothetical protein